MILNKSGGGLAAIASSELPFKAETGEADYFGANHDISVRRVNVSPKLRAVREKLVETLETHGLFVDHTFDPWSPHISAINGILLPAGRELTIGALSVITSVDGVKRVADQFDFKK